MMTALVLAGGKGTRLGGNIPKAMLEVNGRTLIQRQIDYLANTDISDIILCLGYLADKVRYNAPESVKIHESLEGSPLGTAGAVKQAFKTYPSLLNDSVYVLNVDDLARIPKEELHRSLKLSVDLESQIVFGRPIPYSIWANGTMYSQNKTYQHIGHTILTRNMIEGLPEIGSLEIELAKLSMLHCVEIAEYLGEWNTCNTYDEHRTANERITATERLLEIKEGKRTGI